MNDGLAFDDAGEKIPFENFDWDAVEKEFAEDLEQFKKELKANPLSQEDIDRIDKAMQTLLKWAWQGGMKNMDGFQIRMLILCWHIIPSLRALSLTDLSTVFKKDKQSFGRWVDNFKQYFPFIRSHRRWT